MPLFVLERPSIEVTDIFVARFELIFPRLIIIGWFKFYESPSVFLRIGASCLIETTLLSRLIEDRRDAFERTLEVSLIAVPYLWDICERPLLCDALAADEVFGKTS